MCITFLLDFIILFLPYLVVLSSSYRRIDGITHVFASLICNGSEDHLKNCSHSVFMEDVNCYTIATAVCKGMWKHMHVRYRTRPMGMPSVIYTCT